MASVATCAISTTGRNCALKSRGIKMGSDSIRAASIGDSNSSDTSI